MNAVDTNVFVYAFDADEPVKQTKAQELLARLIQPPADTILLWQVAAELLSCLRKWESAAKIAPADTAAHFQDVLAMFPIQLPSKNSFKISFDLRGRFGLSHWDSILLTAAKEAAVDLIYSEDMDAGTNYDGVTIINPFV